MRKTKFIVKTSKSSIPCDETEIPKIMSSIADGSVCMLKQGIFNPSYFESITEDGVFMAKFADDNKYDIRDGKIVDYPLYKDLFANLRASMKSLEAGTNINKKLN